MLLPVLRNPSSVTTLSPSQWNRLLRESRTQSLCARLSWLLSELDLHRRCPAPAWEELESQRFFATHKQAQVRLELRKLQKVLGPRGIAILLLKGAAYAQRDLVVSRGRDFADVDIMLPRARLEEAETALEAAGWVSQTENAYDQRYYRRWMHELPPMHHRARGLEVDIHHAWLPLTGRLHPSTDLIWAAGRPLKDTPYLVPCDEDLFLHCAAQIFQDGPIAGELSGLLDLHQMLQEFGAEPSFWERVVPRAEQLELGRPLYYALTSCVDVLDSPVPAPVLAEIQAFAPTPAAARLMRIMIRRAVSPQARRGFGHRLAEAILYLRSHWLRMPPGLLLVHLLRKTARRFPKLSRD
jgi:hypothetical protein